MGALHRRQYLLSEYRPRNPLAFPSVLDLIPFKLIGLYIGADMEGDRTASRMRIRAWNDLR